MLGLNETLWFSIISVKLFKCGNTKNLNITIFWNFMGKVVFKIEFTFCLSEVVGPLNTKGKAGIIRFWSVFLNAYLRPESLGILATILSSMDPGL